MFQCDPIRLTVACSSYGDITSGVVEAIAAILQLREPWRRGGGKKGKGRESVSYLQIEILDTPLSLHIGRGAAFRFSASFANFIW